MTTSILAKMVARQDDEVDALYAKIFHHLMGYMAQMETAEKIEAAYEALRAAASLSVLPTWLRTSPSVSSTW